MNSLNYDMRPISPDGWVDYLNVYNKRVESRMDEILDVLAQNRRRLREMHNGLMSIEPPPLAMLQQSINQFAESLRNSKEVIELRKKWFPGCDVDKLLEDFGFIINQLGANYDPIQFLNDCALGIVGPKCEWSQVYGYLDERKSQGSTPKPETFFTMLETHRRVFLDEYDMV